MPASGQAADPSTSNIQAIFEVAFDEYGTHTGQDLKKHPFAADFECCNSPDAALDIIRKQARVLDESNGGKLLRSLSPVVHILSGFSETLGEGIGLTFGPAKVIFTGIAVLLEAVKDVAASRDALVQLFERIELFLLRLKLHTKISLTDTMAKILGKFMAHILSVLVLSTEEMKRPLIAKSFKMLIGRKDIDDALHRLDILTIEEIAAMMARNLDATLLKGKIKDWLNPPDYSINHHTAREKQHEGTTKWFIGDSRFTGWKAKGSLLWICGNPGSGKSVLCSAIIENVKQTQGDSSLIAFHYFDHGDDTKHNLRGLLSSLVFQLAVSSNRCWGVLRALHSQCRDGFERPSDADLTRCLKSMVQYPRQLPIYLLIDALDECPNTPGPSARENVLKFLKDLISLNQSNLFICITSRPEHDIRTVLDHLTPPFRRVLLHEEGGQTDDINSFIRSFVELHCNMEGWRKEDKELVIKVLSNRAHGMFQWVWCQLDTVRWCLRADLHDALNNLPTTLDVTYEQALRGIPTIQQPHAHRLFQCLLVALRPLRVQELAEVFKVKFEDTASNLMEDYRHENPEKAVLSTCSTLVTIVGSEDSRVVQFSHFSVKEFLTSHRLRTHGVENIRYYYIPRDFAHSILARVCLTVLLQFNENVDKGLLEKFPLALYAGQNWVDHAKEKDVASRIQDAMKSLFTPDKPYLAAWVWIHDVDMGQIRESTSSLAERPTPPEATALYYAVLCGFKPPEPQLPFNPTREDYRPWMPTPQPFSLFTGKRRALITPTLGYSENLGFKRDDIRIITDKNPLDPPTKANILDAMRELVRDAKPHDSFFLYLLTRRQVSGHSMQIEDMNGDEQDGLDECICAVDWRGIGQPPFEDTPGLITGDVMHDILVGPLPLRCRLTAVFDLTYHIPDLPYVYSSKGEVKHPNKLGLLWEEASANHDSRKASETRKGGDLRLAFINCFITLGYHVTYKQLIDNVSEFMWDNGCKQKPVVVLLFCLLAEPFFVAIQFTRNRYRSLVYSVEGTVHNTPTLKGEYECYKEYVRVERD
ncbi:caspase domain-containing protein [Russula brevipes]|nr:caspase domain-containing protein [Russula brevipes]